MQNQIGVLSSPAPALKSMRTSALEKFLKALLEEAGQSIPKTHDLLYLMGLIQQIHPGIAEPPR